MIISLLVAEVVLVLLVVVDRWVDIAPFNDLSLARARSFGARARETFVACAPLLVALACTAARLAPDSPAWMGLAPVAALSFALALSVQSAWMPWWQGVPAPLRARAAAARTAALRPSRSRDDVTVQAATRGSTPPAGDTDVHAFLEPRRAGAVVPSTFQCLVHAHATACALMALIALVGH